MSELKPALQVHDATIVPSSIDGSSDGIGTKLDQNSLSDVDVEKQNRPAQLQQDSEPKYPEGKELWLIMMSVYMVVFLGALDRTIIATAIPAITNRFDSFTDIGWYGSAFLLTFCCFQLIFGRVYTFYSPKWVYIASIAIFELGSIVCAAAPNSVSFIIGRAIAGLGSAGTMSGGFVIIINTLPLHKRPKWQGFVGAIFGVASVAGPLVGGVFTTDVTWRWCFWINLPIGGVTMLVLAIFLKLPGAVNAGAPWKQQLLRMDPLGTFVFLPAIVCILLALEWGGSQYNWSNWRIILLLTLGSIMLVAFVGVQFWNKENATVPPRILKHRSIAAAAAYIFCLGTVMMISAFYLPLWFQAIKGATAVHSGIMTLPLMFSLVFGTISAGVLTGKIGYYAPFMIVASVMLSVGAGLLTTFHVDTGHSKWIGFQVILGLGIGWGMQQPNIAAQTVLEKKDVPTGMALIFFCQTLGGAIFLSVAQAVLNNRLSHNLRVIPGIDPKLITNTGATELKHVIPEQYHDTVLVAYNNAIVHVFYMIVAIACCSIFGALAIEWRSVKKIKKEP